MKRLFLLIALASTSFFLATTSLFAETKGAVAHIKSEQYEQVIITGDAANSLYESLSLRNEALIRPCGNSMSVRVAPMLCVKKQATVCYMELKTDQADFQIPDHCDRPEPSIIGVGNFRTKESGMENEQGEAFHDKFRKGLHELDIPGRESLKNELEDLRRETKMDLANP